MRSPTGSLSLRPARSLRPLHVAVCHPDVLPAIFRPHLPDLPEISDLVAVISRSRSHVTERPHCQRDVTDGARATTQQEIPCSGGKDCEKVAAGRASSHSLWRLS